MKRITRQDTTRWSKYILEISGISMSHAKAGFLESRLAPLLERHGIKSYEALLGKARHDVTGILRQKIIDAVSVNETRFFRDKGPFEALKKKILPDLIQKRKENASGRIPVRIWSTACATGQEVYSIAITVKEALSDISKYDIHILGTDISEAAIAKAKSGIYSNFEVERGLSMRVLKKYFVHRNNSWEINSDIKKMPVFRRLNLLHSLNGMEKWDIVFCRNVVIYFQQTQRKKFFNQIADILEPDGCLIAGASESLAAICSRFELNRHSNSVFYKRRP